MIEPTDQKPDENPYSKIVGRTPDFVVTGNRVVPAARRRRATAADSRAAAGSNKAEGQYKRQANKGK